MKLGPMHLRTQVSVNAKGLLGPDADTKLQAIEMNSALNIARSKKKQESG